MKYEIYPGDLVALTKGESTLNVGVYLNLAPSMYSSVNQTRINRGDPLLVIAVFHIDEVDHKYELNISSTFAYILDAATSGWLLCPREDMQDDIIRLCKSVT